MFTASWLFSAHILMGGHRAASNIPHVGRDPLWLAEPQTRVEADTYVVRAQQVADTLARVDMYLVLAPQEEAFAGADGKAAASTEAVQ